MNCSFYLGFAIRWSSDVDVNACLQRILSEAVPTCKEEADLHGSARVHCDGTCTVVVGA